MSKIAIIYINVDSFASIFWSEESLVSQAALFGIFVTLPAPLGLLPFLLFIFGKWSWIKLLN